MSWLIARVHTMLHNAASRMLFRLYRLVGGSLDPGCLHVLCNFVPGLAGTVSMKRWSQQSTKALVLSLVEVPKRCDVGIRTR